MRFRIGINLGDVLIEGDNLMGDGVNVAARLEALAPPGGVYVSESISEQVGNRLDVASRRPWKASGLKIFSDLCRFFACR